MQTRRPEAASPPVPTSRAGFSMPWLQGCTQAGRLVRSRRQGGRGFQAERELGSLSSPWEAVRLTGRGRDWGRSKERVQGTRDSRPPLQVGMVLLQPLLGQLRPPGSTVEFRRTRAPARFARPSPICKAETIRLREVPKLVSGRAATAARRSCPPNNCSLQWWGGGCACVSVCVSGENGAWHSEG